MIRPLPCARCATTRKRPRSAGPCLILMLGLSLLAVLALAPLCRATSTIPLPQPIDGLLDVLLGYPPNLAPGNSPDDPQIPQVRKPKAKTPQNILPLFLGIPYRPDGVINDAGQYATFNEPGTPLASPGLNCSGMVLAVSRILLDKNIRVADAKRDREGDSGPGSPDGHDWDFGFDLIMNISEGFPRAFLLPRGATAPQKATGKTVPTFDPHDPNFTRDLFPQLTEGLLYLVSFSRHATQNAPPRLHYHTGVIVRDKNAVWVYSTTRNSGYVIRHNLATQDGLARFRESFKNSAGSYKRLTIIAVLTAD